MKIEAFFHEPTYTLTYVVFDEATKDAVVIDPVLDYSQGGSQTSTTSIDEISDFIKAQGLRLHHILETHAHADHLSGAPLLQARFEAPTGIGEKISVVQETFKALFDLSADFPTDGRQFDRLIADGDVLKAGALNIEALATPGHTPACMTYKIGDAIFTGDALFIEDYGTGRCDFPNGSADDLYTSVHDILYALPDETRVFVGHDYQPNGRALRYETTIGAEKAANVRLTAETTRDAFVKFRNERDAGLAAPKLLFPSVQVNINAGRLPKPHANGTRYLSIPINMFGPTDDIGRSKEADRQK